MSHIVVLKQTWIAFTEDKALRLASAIAFSAIFSIAPLFIILIAVIGFALGTQNGGHGHHIAEAALLSQIEHSIGKNAANTISQLITNAFNKPRQGLIAQVAGWITFLIGASALFSSLQDALNSIWHIEVTRGGWKQVVRDRLMSFGMLAVVGFLLVISLVGTLAVGSIGTGLLQNISILKNSVVVELFSQIFTAALVMLVFSAMYKFLPDVKLTWRDIFVGAFATTVLFIVGEALVIFYLRVAGVTSSYGAAGSILVALLWIYYTAAIFLLGAEYTKTQAQDAFTTVATKLRTLTDLPAGIDPRTAAGISNPSKDAA